MENYGLSLLSSHCLILYREGLGSSLKIMGLATIDPHSHKVQTKLYKIPKFGVNRPNGKIYKECIVLQVQVHIQHKGTS